MHLPSIFACLPFLSFKGQKKALLCQVILIQLYSLEALNGLPRSRTEVFCSNFYRFYSLTTQEFETCIVVCLQLCFILYTSCFAALSGLKFSDSTVTNYLSLAGTSRSPREPRFVLVPVRFASDAWPRPGLTKSQSASIAGFGNMGPLFMIKTSRYLKLIDFSDGVGGLSWRRSWGPLLFEALIASVGLGAPGLHFGVLIWA